MNNWKVIFATAVIFGAGVITGGLLVNHVDRSHPKKPRHQELTGSTTNSILQSNGQNPQASRLPRLPEVLSKQFLQRLDEELHLTPDQREAIQKIVTEGQNQMRKAIQDARLEIREQLTPEQRVQFDVLVKHPPRRPPNATNAPPANPAAALTNTPGA